MKQIILLASIFAILASCIDSPPPNRSSRDYDREPAVYRDRYGNVYRDRPAEGSYRRSARERMQAGTYGTQPGGTVQRPAPVDQAKEEKGWVDPNKAIARKYPIGTVGYQEIEPMIKSQLSPRGGVQYLKNFNSILVLDYPANHEKVKALLGAVVRDAVNVRVDVEFAATQGMKNLGIEVHTGGITIDKGGINLPDRADVHIDARTARKDTNTRQFLTTLSGSAARLWVTETRVDRQLFQHHRFIPFTRVGGIVGVPAVAFPAPQVREIGTSLWIRPVYTDNGQVIIELFPVLTTEINGREQSFRVEKVETKIVARPGQRVFLGGMNKQTSNFFASIFQPIGAGKGSHTDVVNIYVTPSIMKVGSRR